MDQDDQPPPIIPPPPPYTPKESDVIIDVEKNGEKPNYSGTANSADSITVEDFKKLKEIEEKYEKAKFLRKVYTIVLLQLLNVASFVLLFTCNEQVNSWVRINRYIILVFGMVSIIMYSVHSCCRHYNWTFLNFSGFVMYTVAEGLFLGSFTTIFNIDLLLFACGFTIFLSLALTFYAFKTSTNYTLHSTNLYGALIVLLIFGFFAMVMRDVFPMLFLVAIFAGDVLFSVYLIHNTQRVSQTNDLSSAVIIFVAHVNLFIFLAITLEILSDM